MTQGKGQRVLGRQRLPRTPTDDDDDVWQRTSSGGHTKSPRRRPTRRKRAIMGRPAPRTDDGRDDNRDDREWAGAADASVVGTLPPIHPKQSQQSPQQSLPPPPSRPSLTASTPGDDQEDADNEEGNEVRQTPTGRPPAKLRSVGHATSEGSTGHANEDRLVVKSGRDFHLLAVMDGHGGHHAAEFLVDRLFGALEVAFSESEGFTDHQRIVRTVEELDAAFLTIARRRQDYSGVCVVAALVYWDPNSEDHQLLVLNCGDCRVILHEQPTTASSKSSQRLGRRQASKSDKESTTTVVALSTDHCASNRAEKLRALEAGAFIRNGRIAGILEPFRSIGDLDMKGPSMRGWVVPTPELRQRPLRLRETTLVLATDGVWGTLSNERVMNLALQRLRHGGDAQGAADAIADEARERGSTDDITVIVATL